MQTVVTNMLCAAYSSLRLAGHRQSQGAWDVGGKAAGRPSRAPSPTTPNRSGLLRTRTTGDVQGGRGRLELADGAIDADYLEREVIVSMNADVGHVLLDSCNSFFVLNPRKPGGRRWATPEDTTRGVAQRHPNVGVLLSTNAEADVYEWSQLEAGVFSHEVRSGLTGAADVDGDGQVTYEYHGRSRYR